MENSLYVLVHLVGNDPYDHGSMDTAIRPLTTSIEKAKQQLEQFIEGKASQRAFVFYRVVLLDVVTGVGSMLLERNTEPKKRIEVNIAAKKQTNMAIKRATLFDENMEECDDHCEDDDIDPVPSPAPMNTFFATSTTTTGLTFI